MGGGGVMAVAEAEGVKPVCLSAENTASGSMVEDFFAVVRGGSSESVTALVAKKLPTPELMNLWGDGVSFNPDFIRTTVSLLVFCRTFVFWCVSFTPAFLLSTSCNICSAYFTPNFHSHSLSCAVFPALPAGGITVCWKEHLRKGLSQCHQDWHTGREAKCSGSIDQVQQQTV